MSATIHETGHGLYEQGLPQDLRPLGPPEAASTGMHESQSRFWENQVGRSAALFEWLTPLLQSDPPPHSARDLFQAANAVRSTPIRVESDELSYNLHILIRYQLERRLLDGELSAADLPQAWDDAYEHWLGFRPARWLRESFRTSTGRWATTVISATHWATCMRRFWQLHA